MANAIWQNKSLLKTGNLYKMPDNIKNQPKGISKEDWEADVKEFKLNKLIILDKVPKAKRSTPRIENDEE
jgi:hypothetical protein